MGRNVLWGARRGDRQLASRTGLQLANLGSAALPTGSTCIGASPTRSVYWFWIPFT